MRGGRNVAGYALMEGGLIIDLASMKGARMRVANAAGMPEAHGLSGVPLDPLPRPRFFSAVSQGGDACRQIHH